MGAVGTDEYGGVVICKAAAVVHHYILLRKRIITAMAAGKLLILYGIWLRLLFLFKYAHGEKIEVAI
jgi:hypothetical protein